MTSILQLIWRLLLKLSTGKNADDWATSVEHSKFAARVNSYLSRFDETLNKKWDSTKDAIKKNERVQFAQQMTNDYYNIATDFYEYGWGQSFHFATRAPNESFETSIVRHEHQLAHWMEIKEGDRVLDVGCGIGGPLRNIARFTKAHITGLNNNEYQVKRADRLNSQYGLSEYTKMQHGDFMKTSSYFQKDQFDKIYAIEATCHSPDRTKTYNEIFKVLKPGGVFAVYEWCMTDLYDPNNPKHNQVKHGIEIGNSLPTLAHYKEIVQNFKDAGFEIEQCYDLADSKHMLPGESPWWSTFVGKWTLSQFKHTRFGRKMTNLLCWITETLYIAPKGTYKTASFLCETGDALAESGRLEIFTPMYFVKARKPTQKKIQ